ncbi:MAG TPA: hypothetical protein VL728_12595 [Cyclobacteriaceae bacterium]|jgi:hypothetical protein|nr:hypothetical protein [Cyclobacteriaceae bacterium]
MENFDQIDDYLRGQLNGHEKEAFEQQLKADPSLKSELDLQKQLIEGIKNARISQLKTMLSQVPVTGAMTSGAGLSAGQIAAGVITSAIVATGTLFYFQPWKASDKVEVKTEQPVTETATTKTEPKVEAKTSENTKESKTRSAIESKTKASKEVVTPQVQAVRPNLQVVDPTSELTSTPSTEEKAKVDKNIGAVSDSRIEVENVDNDKQYSFHYQFSQGKLILYGKFDKALYEIIEINGSSHSVFLYYKDAYYTLDEKEATVTPLTAIRDKELLKKLKEYRKG